MKLLVGAVIGAAVTAVAGFVAVVAWYISEMS